MLRYIFVMRDKIRLARVTINQVVQISSRAHLGQGIHRQHSRSPMITLIQQLYNCENSVK